MLNPVAKLVIQEAIAYLPKAIALSAVASAHLHIAIESVAVAVQDSHITTE